MTVFRFSFYFSGFISLLSLFLTSLTGGATYHTVTFDRSHLSIHRERGYDVIKFKDGVSTLDEGFPDLPAVGVSLLLPSGALPDSVRILNVVKEPVDGMFTVFPAQKPTIPGEVASFTDPEQSVYELTDVYPAQSVKLSNAGTMGGYNMVSVLVYPVQYVPSDRLLFLNREISFAVNFSPVEGRLPGPERRYERSQRYLEKIVGGVISNGEAIPLFGPRLRLESHVGPFDPEDFPSLSGSAVEYLIVTNETMKPVFEPLARWKTRKGVPCVVKTVSDIKATTRNGADDAETLRNFISDAYEKWGVMWVLLGGDVSVIPARYVEMGEDGKTAVSDLYYADLDGNWNSDGDALWGERVGDEVDTYPDVFVGRAPVETVEEAESFVDKTLSYEQGMGNHQNRILYLGEDLGGWPGDGQYYCELMDSHVHQEWFEKTKLYENSGNQSRSTTLSAMNDGQNLIFSVSHGNAYRVLAGPPGHAIEHSDAYSLTNGDNYSIFYGVTCNTNDISYDDSFSENFILNPTGGGIGYVGSTWMDYPSISRVQNEEFFRLLFEEDEVMLGAALGRARLPVLPYMSIMRYRQAAFTYLLLGDPELDVFTNIPSDFSVSMPHDLSLGPSEVRIVVTEIAPEETPVPQVLVCLQKEGDVYKTGMTDPAGEVVFSVSPHTVGSIKVTATKHNYTPFTGQIEVEQTAGPHVHISDYRIDDEAGGNGDTFPNPGERVFLYISVLNSGQSEITGSGHDPIRAVLSSSSPLVQIVVDTFAISNSILPSHKDTALFELSIDPMSPDEVRVPFLFSIQNDQGIWNDTLNPRIRSPVLHHLFTRSRSLDSRYDCTLTVRNEGTGPARGVKARLATVRGNAQLLDDSHDYGDFQPWDANEGEFAFRIISEPRETILELALEDTFGHSWKHRFDLVVPVVPQGLSHLAGRNEISLFWHRGGEEDLLGYFVFRSEDENGPYERLNRHAIRGTAYYEDAGLAPSRQYYYKISVVDSSGNESPLSKPVLAWTESQMTDGWPVELGNLVWSGPSIADVNGDGDKELFIGGLNGVLYAFEHTGVELIDSDHDPATLRGFVSTGHSIWSSPALGYLDSDPILDIVVSPRGSPGEKSLYAWQTVDYDGDGEPDSLPGWPTSFQTRRGMISSPVLANVDDDAQMEVIVMDQTGATYVWEHNGTLKEGWPRTAGSGTGRGQLYATVSVGDLDGDSESEIVACGGNRSQGRGSIYVWGHDSLSEPMVFETPGPFSASPVLADLDGDGELEIVALSELHRVYVLHSDGAEMDGWENGKELRVVNIDNLNRITPSPAVGDLDRDGWLEVIVPGIRSLMVWNSDGTKKAGFPIENMEAPASPVIADVDGHGDTEIIFGTGNKKMNAVRWDGTMALGFPVSLNGPVRASGVVEDIDGDGLNEVAWAADDFKLYMVETKGDSSLVDWGSFHGDMGNRGAYGAFASKGNTDGPAVRSAPLSEIFTLHPNFPNPFNPSTTLRFSVPELSHVTLTVYDIVGREVTVLVDGKFPPGTHEYEWNPRGFSSGIYLIKLAGGEVVRTRKVTVLR